MSECKHGLKSGCAYCHAATPSPTVVPRAVPKSRAKPTRLSEKMNDRMTLLQARLRKLRGES